MRCSLAKRRLTEYVYGDLGERERVGIRSHLASCSSCRETADEIRGILSMASAYVGKSPPAGAYAGLRERVASRPERRRFRLFVLERPIPAYAAATAIAILAVVSGISTRTEMARLERMNSLLSDSLRVLNSQFSGRSFSEPSDSAARDTLQPHTTGSEAPPDSG